MTNKLEIYIRDTHSGTMLNIYAPSALTGCLASLARNGEYTEGATLELSLLPEWISDESDRRKLIESKMTLHVRIPVASIHVHLDSGE